MEHTTGWSGCTEVEPCPERPEILVLKGTAFSPEVVIRAYMDGESPESIGRRFEGWTPERVTCVLDYVRAQNPELLQGERGKTYDWSGCPDVEQVSGKCSGAPILVGTRVFAEQIPGCAASGMTAQEIADSYELDVDQVRRVLAYTSTRAAMPQ